MGSYDLTTSHTMAALSQVITSPFQEKKKKVETKSLPEGPHFLFKKEALLRNSNPHFTGQL